MCAVISWPPALLCSPPPPPPHTHTQSPCPQRQSVSSRPVPNLPGSHISRRHLFSPGGGGGGTIAQEGWHRWSAVGFTQTKSKAITVLDYIVLFFTDADRPLCVLLEVDQLSQLSWDLPPPPPPPPPYNCCDFLASEGWASVGFSW